MLEKILELAHEISISRKADVFVRYSGHVKCLDVDIHINGWAVGSEKTYEKSVYIRGKEDKEKEEKNIEEVLQLLQSIYNDQPPVVEAGQCELCKRKIWSDEEFKEFKGKKVCIGCAEEFSRGE